MVTVAIFGADEDSVLVRLGLRDEGFVAIGAYVQEVHAGAVDLAGLLEAYRPDVVIYDIVQPAARNRRWLRRLERACHRLAIPCVLTVRDVGDLHYVSTEWAACLLIRPYNAAMAQLAIREAMKLEDERSDDRGDDPGEAAA